MLKDWKDVGRGLEKFVGEVRIFDATGGGSIKGAGDLGAFSSFSCSTLVVGQACPSRVSCGGVPPGERSSKADMFRNSKGSSSESILSEWRKGPSAVGACVRSIYPVCDCSQVRTELRRIQAEVGDCEHRRLLYAALDHKGCHVGPPSTRLSDKTC